MNYRFRPRLLPTLATLIVAAACIRLGLWQQHKAEMKQALQTQLELRMNEAPVALPRTVANLDDWRYRPVRLRGTYDARYQILLDNQMQDEVAGYHVVTPLRVEHRDYCVLVDRGWIAAPPDHSIVPNVTTPSGTQEIEGHVWLPGKFFALQQPPTPGGEWQTVWQNMDLHHYAQSVPFAVLPLAVRLDPHSAGGGFVREWPKPAERIEQNRGYAYQWFGFAIAAILIYLAVNIRKARD